MLLRLLQFLLIIALIRALWRLGKGMLEGAGYKRVDGPAAPAVTLQRDPVCGSFVSPVSAPALRLGGKTLYFCSEKCRREWERR
jgi:YHS domain-containing protein